MKLIIEEFNFTLEDMYTTKPYEYVMAIQDPFERERAIKMLADYAKSIKFNGFLKMLNSYKQSLRAARAPVYYIDKVTSFEGQPLELISGSWDATDEGIYRDTGLYEECACVHPIMPVERLVNIDTGTERLKLAFRKGAEWRYVIVEKRVLASAAAITSLADLGVAVTSENAKALVRYLHDVENLNYDTIPETLSVSRLGWIDGYGFAPYCAKLTFDGDERCRALFEAVKPRGEPLDWFVMAAMIRKGTVTGRIVLAASFASALVKPLHALPFFVHLWGGSEVGKTVALMLAASVWANPAMGKYIHTFNSTTVGKEMAAAFLNSLPLILDELQIEKTKGSHDEDIYRLAEGVGRMRSNKCLGLNRTPTWANCIITSGEMPITTAKSGGGAINRIIEIECKERIFSHPRAVVEYAQKSYGHAGKMFVEKLTEEGFNKAQRLFRSFLDELQKGDITEKQALSAAIILTADTLATQWIFQDNRALTVEEMREFLQTRASVDVNGRGYQYMCEWVSQNASKLTGFAEIGECWGALDVGSSSGDDWAYIVRSKFNAVAEEAGYNPQALLSYLRQKGLIRTRGRALTVNRRISGVATECVALKLPSGDPLDKLDEYDVVGFVDN